MYAPEIQSPLVNCMHSTYTKQELRVKIWSVKSVCGLWSRCIARRPHCLWDWWFRSACMRTLLTGFLLKIFRCSMGTMLRTAPILMCSAFNFVSESRKNSDTQRSYNYAHPDTKMLSRLSSATSQKSPAMRSNHVVCYIICTK